MFNKLSIEIKSVYSNCKRFKDVLTNLLVTNSVYNVEEYLNR
jgi:hypothetical protein